MGIEVGRRYSSGVSTGGDPRLQYLADRVIDGVLAQGQTLFADAQPVAAFGGLGDRRDPPAGGVAATRLEEATAEAARRRSALQHLEERGAQIVEAAGRAGVEARGAVQQLREQTRAQVDAMMSITDPAQRTKLVMSALDQAMGHMQQHIAATWQANAQAAAQLRDLAEAYNAHV